MEVIAKTKKMTVKRKVSPVKELKFKNRAEDLKQFEGDRDFFLGLQALSEKFSKEIRAYGDGYKIEINTIVQFEVVKD